MYVFEQRINHVKVQETKIVAVAATNAPGVLGVV
jgi:tRNA A37 threonylcarbamoyltransferase TsaD